MTDTTKPERNKVTRHEQIFNAVLAADALQRSPANVVIVDQHGNNYNYHKICHKKIGETEVYMCATVCAQLLNCKLKNLLLNHGK